MNNKTALYKSILTPKGRGKIAKLKSFKLIMVMFLKGFNVNFIVSFIALKYGEKVSAISIMKYVNFNIPQELIVERNERENVLRLNKTLEKVKVLLKKQELRLGQMMHDEELTGLYNTDIRHEVGCLMKLYKASLEMNTTILENYDRVLEESKSSINVDMRDNKIKLEKIYRIASILKKADLNEY